MLAGLPPRRHRVIAMETDGQRGVGKGKVVGLHDHEQVVVVWTEPVGAPLQVADGPDDVDVSSDIVLHSTVLDRNTLLHIYTLSQMSSQAILQTKLEFLDSPERLPAAMRQIG